MARGTGADIMFLLAFMKVILRLRKTPGAEGMIVKLDVIGARNFLALHKEQSEAAAGTCNPKGAARVEAAAEQRAAELDSDNVPRNDVSYADDLALILLATRGSMFNLNVASE